MMRSQNGASLLEVLIAVFIFATGILAFASAQLRTLRQADDNSQRAYVAWKARELAERININPAVNYTAVGTIGDDSGLGLAASAGYSCPSTHGALCAETWSHRTAPVCTSTQMAEYDVWDVFCDPDAGLSSHLSDMEVYLRIHTTSGRHELYVEWSDRTATGDADISAAMVTTDPCGTGENRQVANNLNLYCLRF